MRSVWPNWEGGNLIRTTDAAGAQTVYTYDTEGQLLTVTDALNNVTSYTYDALGRLLTTTDARGTVTRNTYDAVGNLLKTVQFDGTALSAPVGTWLDIEQDFNGSSTIKILGGRADIDYKVRLFVKGNAQEARLIYQITISYTATLRYEGYYGECKQLAGNLLNEVRV